MIMLSKTTAFLAFLLLLSTYSYSQEKEVVELDSGSPVKLTGELQIYQADDLKNKKAWNEYWLKISEKETIRLDGEDLQQLSVESGNMVTVTGEKKENSIFTSFRQVQSTGSSLNSNSNPKVVPNPVYGAAKKLKVALILIKFSDNPTENYTSAAARDILFGNTPGWGANNFFSEVSDGKFSLVGKNDPAGDVYGWYTLNINQDDCDHNWDTTWRNAANQMAHQVDGFDPVGYDVVIYNFPDPTAAQVAGGTVNCAWSGIASTNKPLSIQTYQPYIFINGPWTPTYIHEIGHILGLTHANSLSCVNTNGNRVSIDHLENCTDTEYGDPFDIMGAADYFYYNIRNKDFLKMGNANMRYVTTTGTYLLKSGNYHSNARGIAAGNYGLRIPVATLPGSFELYYYIESRTNKNWDLYMPPNAQSGITIHLGVNQVGSFGLFQSSKSHSYLLDTHPITATFDDAPLQVGEVFRDIERGLAITYLGQSGGLKQVKVEFLQGPIQCTQIDPLVTITPALQIVNGGSSATYQYTLVNQDSGSNCVTRVFKPNVGGVANLQINSTPITLLPGASASDSIVATSTPQAVISGFTYLLHFEDFFTYSTQNFDFLITP